MSQHTKKYQESISEFNKSIYPFTLRFKTQEMEDQYKEQLSDSLAINKAFKIALIILLATIAIRRIEVALFAIFSIDVIASSEISRYLLVLGLGLTCVVELIVYWIHKLQLIQGLATMIYCYFTAAYTSYTGDEVLKTLPS